MKSFILAFIAFLSVRLASCAGEAHVLDLEKLKFVLWGNHGSGTKTSVATGSCPLGTLPDGVLMHKTFEHKDHHFTLVMPVHRVVKKVVCGSRPVWEGAGDHEFLVEFHYFGGKGASAKRLVHLAHTTKLGGLAHVFLEFEAAAAAKVLGLAKFVVALAGGVFDKDFLALKGLPALPLFHDLALHVAAV